MDTIRNLKAITKQDTATVGTKATALAELMRAGFNVPPGIVLTTAAYSRAMAQMQDRIAARLRREVIDDPGELEPAAAEVRAWIVDGPWNASMSAELETALAPLLAEGAVASFAARTSLPSDDLATAFGAGVERAALGLAGMDNLRRGIATCWAALWTSRSIYYRNLKKIPQTSVALAVLVQPMMRADTAGVLFTQNHMTGNPSEIQIDSIWGLGGPVTQARVYPDRFIVDKRAGTITDRQIEEKIVRLVVGMDGSVEHQGVADDKIDVPSLTDAQVLGLADVGKRVEALFGEPQDIEWAIAGGEVYLLQARPIALRNS